MTALRIASRRKGESISFPRHKALMDALAAWPLGPAPCLVYADWLEQHGEMEAALAYRILGGEHRGTSRGQRIEVAVAATTLTVALRVASSSPLSEPGELLGPHAIGSDSLPEQCLVWLNGWWLHKQQSKPFAWPLPPYERHPMFDGNLQHAARGLFQAVRRWAGASTQARELMLLERLRAGLGGDDAALASSIAMARELGADLGFHPLFDALAASGVIGQQLASPDTGLAETYGRKEASLEEDADVTNLEREPQAFRLPTPDAKAPGWVWLGEHSPVEAFLGFCLAQPKRRAHTNAFGRTPTPRWQPVGHIQVVSELLLAFGNTRSLGDDARWGSVGELLWELGPFRSAARRDHTPLIAAEFTCGFLFLPWESMDYDKL